MQYTQQSLGASPSFSTATVQFQPGPSTSEAFGMMLMFMMLFPSSFLAEVGEGRSWLSIALKAKSDQKLEGCPRGSVPQSLCKPCWNILFKFSELGKPRHCRAAWVEEWGA
jgi:hypothetical protein